MNIRYLRDENCCTEKDVLTEMKETCALGVYPSMYMGGWIFSQQANVPAFTLNCLNGTVQHIGRLQILHFT